jgi:hypothetical protein
LTKTRFLERAGYAARGQKAHCNDSSGQALRRVSVVAGKYRPIFGVKDYGTVTARLNLDET